MFHRYMLDNLLAKCSFKYWISRPFEWSFKNVLCISFLLNVEALYFSVFNRVLMKWFGAWSLPSITYLSPPLLLSPLPREQSNRLQKWPLECTRWKLIRQINLAYLSLHSPLVCSATVEVPLPNYWALIVALDLNSIWSK